MDDLFISTLINSSHLNRGIMDQSTIKKIIDMQFKEVRPIIRIFLIIYIIGFILPMAINIVFMS